MSSILQTNLIIQDDLISFNPILSTTSNQSNEFLEVRSNRISILEIIQPKNTFIIKATLTSLTMILAAGSFKFPELSGIICGVLTEDGHIKMIYLAKNAPPLILQDIKLFDSIGPLTLVPTLFNISVNGIISVYTKEGLLVSLTLKQTKKKNIEYFTWENIIKKAKLGKLKDIYDINTFTLTNINPSNRAPLNVYQIIPDDYGIICYHILFTPNGEEEGFIYGKYQINDRGYLQMMENFKFPNDEGNLMMNQIKFGLIFQSSKALYFKVDKKQFGSLNLIPSISNEINQINDHLLRFSKKEKQFDNVLNILNMIDSTNETSILIFSSNGSCHQWIFKHRINHPINQLPILQIESITYETFDSHVFSTNIIKISSTKILLFHQSEPIILTLKELTSLKTKDQVLTGPILDMNLVESFIPHLQVSGCFNKTGYLKTITKEFEIIYESIIYKLDKEKDKNLLDYWIIDNYLILFLINGIKIFQNIGNNNSDYICINCDQIKGDVLDCTQFHGDLFLITTEMVISLNGKIYLNNNNNIYMGKFINYDETDNILDQIVYITCFHEVFHGKSHIYSISGSEACSISTLVLSDGSLIIAIGDSDGFIHLIKISRKFEVNWTFKSKRICDKGMIHQILLKISFDSFIILISDIHGLVFICNNYGEIVQKLGHVCLGKSPVHINNYNSHVIFNDFDTSILVELNGYNIFKKGKLGSSYMKIIQDRLFSLDKNQQIKEIFINNENSIKFKTQLFPNQIIRKSIKSSIHQQYTILLTQSTTTTTTTRTNLLQCSLKVISENKLISQYDLPSDIEATDIINMSFKPNTIFSTKTQPMTIQLQTLLSQTFIISIIDHRIAPSLDAKASLMLFTLDEDGIISYQCDYSEEGTIQSTSRDQLGRFIKLLNIGESHIIGVGDVIVLFRIIYDVGSSRFKIERCSSDFIHTRYFTMDIKMLTDDEFVVGDMIYGVSMFKIRPHGKMYLLEYVSEFKIIPPPSSKNMMLNILEIIGPLIISCDQQNNLSIFIRDMEELQCIFNGKIRLSKGESVNVINGVINSTERLNMWIKQTTNKIDDQIIPFALFGTSKGSIIQLSLIINQELIQRVSTEEQKIIQEIKNDPTNIDCLDYENDNENLIDGELILSNSDCEIIQLIKNRCDIFIDNLT